LKGTCPCLGELCRKKKKSGRRSRDRELCPRGAISGNLTRGGTRDPGKWKKGVGGSTQCDIKSPTLQQLGVKKRETRGVV